MVRRGRAAGGARTQLFPREVCRRRTRPRVPARRRQLQPRGFVIRDPPHVRHGDTRPAVLLRAPNLQRSLTDVLERRGAVPAPRHVPKVEHIRGVVIRLVQKRRRKLLRAKGTRRAVFVGIPGRRVVQRGQHELDGRAHPHAQPRVLLGRRPLVVVLAARREHGFREGNLHVDDVGGAKVDGCPRADAVAVVVPVYPRRRVRGDVGDVRAADGDVLVEGERLDESARTLHLVPRRGQLEIRVDKLAQASVSHVAALASRDGLGSGHLELRRVSVGAAELRGSRGARGVELDLKLAHVRPPRGRRVPDAGPVHPVQRRPRVDGKRVDHVLAVHLVANRGGDCRVAHGVGSVDPLELHDVAGQ
mmetsp:Transcript_725/g.2774  ORF Transcript_725/g.2774 Transcript_725/m.2774 type:complete len:361 (+) Transcript_725:94-1176(+)